jgi:aspartate 1-decarboxylase
MCKSKIHHAFVTDANLDYIGSIGIDSDLLERTDILPGEKVSVWNINNGERIETYALPAPAGSGQIIINGAAARRFREGDKIIIVAFVLADEPVTPKMVLVNRENRFVGWLGDNRNPEPSELDFLETATKS